LDLRPVLRDLGARRLGRLGGNGGVLPRSRSEEARKARADEAGRRSRDTGTDPADPPRPQGRQRSLACDRLRDDREAVPLGPVEAPRERYMPTEWYPESTYSVVAVTFRAVSESRYAAAAPTA